MRVDWLIILSERHLVQVLSEYFDHLQSGPGRIAPWASALQSPKRSRMAG